MSPIHLIDHLHHYLKIKFPLSPKKKKKTNFRYPLSRSKLVPLLLFGIIVDSTVLRRNFLIESFNRKSDNMLSYNTYPSRIKCIEVLTFNI